MKREKEDALDRKLWGWLAEAKRYFQHLGFLGIILYLLNGEITPLPMLNTKFLLSPSVVDGNQGKDLIVLMSWITRASFKLV